MRGAVSGGALQALHDLGLRDAFDVVYGSSAGAMNATYFLAGQREVGDGVVGCVGGGWRLGSATGSGANKHLELVPAAASRHPSHPPPHPQGVNIYSDHIANDRFCDMRRLLRRGRRPSVAGDAGAAVPADPPALDLAYLLDEVMARAAPLNWGAVLASPVPLKIVASCVDTLAPVVLDAFTDAADLRACLRASANVPEVAGGPVHHRGRRLVDAAVFEPVPFRAAINDGATHVLTLCTRPPRAGPVARLVGGVVEAAVKRAVMSPDYMIPVWRRETELVRVGEGGEEGGSAERKKKSTPSPPFSSPQLSGFGLCDFDMLTLGLVDPAGAAARAEFGGAALYPVFPGPAAAYSPVCTDVPTIRGGIAEGRAAVERLFGVEAIAEARAAAGARGADARELAARA